MRSCARLTARFVHELRYEPVKPRNRVQLLLLSVPVVVLSISFLLGESRGPYHLAPSSDPDYQYLINSLSILTHDSPNHIDHPGTTVQLFGALVVFSKWGLAHLPGSPQSLAEAVLLAPEDFLHAISFCLNLLIALSLYLSGLNLYRLSGSLLAALLLQFSIFISPEILYNLPSVKPEPLIIAVFYFLSVPLFLGVQERPDSPPRVVDRAALAAGILFGFGVVTKVTFLPVAVLGLVFRGWRRRVLFTLGAIASCLIFTIPIWSKLRRTLRFDYAVLTHAGYYGLGSQGLPALAQIIANLKRLVVADPSLFAFPLYYIVVLVVLQFGAVKKDERIVSGARILLSAVVVAMIFQIALTAKHYLPHILPDTVSSARYALPAMLMLGVANAVSVLLLESRGLNRKVQRALVITGTALLMLCVVHTVYSVRSWIVDARAYRDQIAALDRIRMENPNCATVGFYGSSLQGYALSFAATYTNGQYNALLERIYPTSYALAAGSVVGFSDVSKVRNLSELLQSGGCAFLQGSKTNLAVYGPWLTGFTRTLVAETPAEDLYTLSVKPSN
jgi:hypothetical protein